MQYYWIELLCGGILIAHGIHTYLEDKKREEKLKAVLGIFGNTDIKIKHF